MPYLAYLPGYYYPISPLVTRDVPDIQACAQACFSNLVCAAFDYRARACFFFTTLEDGPNRTFIWLWEKKPSARGSNGDDHKFVNRLHRTLNN